MKQRKAKAPFWQVCPLLICIAIVGVGFAIYSGITALKKQAPSSDATLQVPTSQPLETGTATQTDVPDVTPESTASSPPPETSPPEPKPLEFQSVEESYFDDALFIGDSRTDGLRLYCPPGNATVYAATSMSIFGIMDSSETVDGVTGIRNLLKSRTFGKIYIMFGINEAGYDTTAFVQRYGEVVEEIRSYQPDAIIYIQGIMYVTAAKAQAEPVFSNDNLRAKNEGLKALANGEDIFYLEVNDNLDDGNGNLPSDYSGDGVHLKASYYYLWHDYLLDHAIVLPDQEPPTPAAPTDPA